MTVRDANAPIALFAYNRPAHTRRTLEALRANEGAAASDLYVFCDGPKHEAARAAVAEVRALARSIAGFRRVEVIEQPANLGLASSIIRGVTQVCGQHGRVIVVEDDLVTAPYFLRYMNEALALYRDDAAVGSIHGYWYAVDRPMPDTFFLRGASCWGWATWARAWQQFESDGSKLLRELRTRNLTERFDLEGAIAYTKMLADQIAGRNDSWAIRWHASMFLAGRLQLSPGRSLVQNIGFDSTGTHGVQSSAYDTRLATAPVHLERIPQEESSEARAALIHYYRSSRRSLPVRIVGRLRRMIAR
jgi:glycosyl transferase family 2